MPDLAFPSVGRLGLTSPLSSVLCSATTAACPSQCPMLSLGHRYLVCASFSPASNPANAFPVGSGVFLRAAHLSPFSTRRHSALPSSRVTLLNSCPALRPRWWPKHLPLSHSGLLPSVKIRTSAFPSKKKTDGYPLSTIIQISGLHHTACFLAPPGFGLPLPDLPARFATDLLARL